METGRKPPPAAVATLQAALLRAEAELAVARAKAADDQAVIAYAWPWCGGSYAVRWRASNAGIVSPAALTSTARRWVTFERVIAFPSQVGNSAAASGTAPT